MAAAPSVKGFPNVGNQRRFVFELRARGLGVLRGWFLTKGEVCKVIVRSGGVNQPLAEGLGTRGGRKVFRHIHKLASDLIPLSVDSL